MQIAFTNEDLCELIAVGVREAESLILEKNAGLAGRFLKYVELGAAQDFQQESAIFLLKAARRFDPLKGLKYTTLATWYLKAALKETRRRHRPLAQFGEAFTDVPERTYSHKFPIDPADLPKLLARLSELERYVLRLVVMQKQTLRATGDSVNLTHERIRQIKNEALAKLRKYVS